MMGFMDAQMESLRAANAERLARYGGAHLQMQREARGVLQRPFIDEAVLALLPQLPFLVVHTQERILVRHVPKPKTSTKP